jgi:amino acid adenylation domain-containing protein
MTSDTNHTAALTAEQRKLILQQLQKKRASVSKAQILPYKRETNTFPLSFAQQRLWFLEQMKPGSTAYLIVRVQRFGEDLNVEVLRRSLKVLVQRHEMLRTTFEERDGQPVQVIHAVGHSALPVIDLQGLRQEQRDKEVQRIVSQEGQRPCDLVQGPLLRTSLVRMDKQESMMLLILHHIITDGWSNEILVRELVALYQAFLAGRPSPLPPLPIQYVDYTLWQRQWLQGEVLETQLAYWRKQLANSSPLVLPTDHPRPSVQRYRGATQTKLVSLRTLTQLQMLSQQEGVTTFMLLLTAFQVLLMRYSGQSDISVGTPIANRTRTEIEGVVGFFVNMLVIRSDLSGNPFFTQLLRNVREVCLQAYSHQDIPFEKVVEELKLERDLSCSPLFHVLFALQDASREQIAATEVNVEPFLVEATRSKFDLSLMLTESRAGLYCSLEYNTDLFEPDTITRLLNHWQILLQGLVQTPRARLSELPLLTEDERTRMLIEWNATQAAYPEHCCLHTLFEQQVVRTPDAIAVQSTHEQLTYQRLDRLANQVAYYLQQRGVRPDVLVGIGLERSIALVIGILGILKAGGAYVPLDSSYPEQRLASIVEDAHLSILLTDSHLCASFPPVAQVICLDSEWASIVCSNGEEAPVCTTLPTNLAYVIYTSGSTGRPKGVMIPHQGVVHYVDWSSKHYAVADGSGAPVHSPLSFDLTITSLFPALIVGRRLVLVPEEPGIEALCQVLSQKNEFSVLKITPAHLNILDQTLQPEMLPAAACALIIGGEALHGESVRNWRRYAPATRLINEYGPTETVVGCCIYEIPQDEKIADIVPIGHPIPNTQIYLLDSQMQMVPFGAPGELYIGGVGLGRGYLNRPDLTAERFIANPFSTEPGARLYKTGDLARYISADGTLQYLGRIDGQVKLRGYRIELAEIEAVLRQHPLVADCAVQLQEDGPGGPRLIGYVVRTVAGLTGQDLQEFLREKLPEYMLPSNFVLLESLPLTANGKVDRRRLPQPELSLEQISGAQSAIRSPIEEMILQVWKELLQLSSLGVHDNFFALGGHSLLAIRVMARLQAMFQNMLSVQMLFEAPTVAELAQQVELALHKDERIVMPPLVARARPEEIPLSFAQQRLWFLDRLEPGSTTYLVPRVLSISGVLDVRALECSIQELIHRHEILRTTITMRSGQGVQVIHPVGPYMLPVIDLQGLKQEQREEEVRRQARQEGQRPCDLARGPLLRLSLLRLGNQKHVLLLTLHHIITDGRSNEVLMRELSTLYRAFVAGRSSPLAPLPIQYADYALWQREWLHGEVLEAQLTYWQRELANLSTLRLPTDFPRPVVQSRRNARHIFMLPDDLFVRLQNLSQQEGVTLFMALLAAFQVLLARYSGQEDIVVGTDVANRTQIETEELIGFFVNQLVLRSHVIGHQTFRELLHLVRNTAIDAYLHQDIPFEKIVEALQPERSLQSTPLFSVKMLLQIISAEEKSSQETLNLSGVNVDALSLPIEMTAKLDLILKFFQTPKGMWGVFDYCTDLFKATTIERMAQHFLVLLESICAKPDEKLNALEMFTQQEKEEQRMQRKERESTLSTKLKSIRPTSVNLEHEQLIRTEYFSEQQSVPLVIRPQTANVILSEWVQDHMPFIEAEMRKHGALLFRDFHLPTPADFERLALVICPDLFHENGEHVPVKDVGRGNLYTPVFYAPEKKLLWHNENSFNAEWPMKILFYCARPADQGGETPIADSRKVFQLLAPAIRTPFIEKGIMYVRSYGEGLGLSWQTVFRTTNKQEVEVFCHKNSIDFEWKEGGRLQTRQVRPAVLKHPNTGEMVWWNQATHWHPAFLDKDLRADLLALFTPENLPRNCFYGDGTPIEDAVADAISRAYEEAEISFPWQTGDILMLDNMLFAHARNPYRGERKLYVSMGNMVRLQDL